MKTSTKALRNQMLQIHFGYRLAAIGFVASLAVVECAGVLHAGSPYDVPVQGAQMPYVANQF